MDGYSIIFYNEGLDVVAAVPIVAKKRERERACVTIKLSYLSQCMGSST